GETQESRHSRETVIEKLAAPEKLSGPAEQKNTMAVRRELEDRALRGDTEAMVIMGEVREKTQEIRESERTVEKETVTGKTAIPQVGEGRAGVTVNVAAELAPTEEKVIKTEKKAEGVKTDEIKPADEKPKEKEEEEAQEEGKEPDPEDKENKIQP
ncbi:hypothetical protein JXA05_02130, partial [Candidatus Peregrinibacteria bacterium]|nr:hypothetical protein [Candidatus Peregrinibacteria bacterium]